ncbi:MAG TPA: ABC transporter permease [Candidatus Dormibacteraeota bacterium]|nr:ABC transporter permease [Candidatus Dormibacteraeota bacterium]
MFLRLITDSVTRRPRRKLLTIAALALGMAVVTAALSVSLDVGDRLSQEFRSLGANLVVTPQADSLPLEIGGVDYRPANSGAYLPESDLPKIKSVFWHNNIIGFAPVLEVRIASSTPQFSPASAAFLRQSASGDATLVGTWSSHSLPLSDGNSFLTGASQTRPWWRVKGDWFQDDASECIVGSRFASRNSLSIGSPLILAGPTGDQGVALKVTGILESGGAEDDSVIAPLSIVQAYLGKPGLYRKLYVSALTKPEDDFARRNPKTMTSDEFERWSCSPYVSSIAYSIQQVLPGSDVRVIHRIADGEGQILTRVRSLLWLVTLAALLAAALAVGASSAASVIERRSELALMKALGAGSTTVGFLLAAEQLLLAFVGGTIGYTLGLFLARIVGTKIFGVAPAPSLLVLGVILALAILVTLLGSALPLRRATRCEPAPILRGE